MKKYPFDVNTTIAPNSYLIIWADDLKTTAKYAHSGFSLSGTYGQVVLSNSHGAILDSVTYFNQSEDVSTGRCPNATGNFIDIKTPTFKESNNFFCSAGIKEAKTYKNLITVYPNPANGQVTFSSNSFNISTIELYNRYGTLVKNSLFTNKKSTINLDGLASGIYVYMVKDKHGVMSARGVLTVIK